MSAEFTGVGVGPGDPELMTMKAHRLIKHADVLCFITSENGRSQAKDIAAEVLSTVDKSQEEIPIVMPMSDDRTLANARYDAAAKSIFEAVDRGKHVVFLCEGDPLFFGSFAYLLERLQDRVHCEVVPGISSVHAASSALKLPLTMQRESFAVVNGRHSEADLVNALATHDSVVIMKAGRSRQTILSALAATNRTEDANYLEYIGRDAEVIVRDVSLLEAEAGPYFSLFVVTRKNRDRG